MSADLKDDAVFCLNGLTCRDDGIERCLATVVGVKGVHHHVLATLDREALGQQPAAGRR